MLRLGFLTHVNGHGDIRRTYAETLELFVAADELGFDVGWVAQHHFDNTAGGLSAPWPFLAAAAARTRRIRLSTAITILPLEHPLALAEQLAVVDTISGGRVEIGVGSGYDPATSRRPSAGGRGPPRRPRAPPLYAPADRIPADLAYLLIDPRLRRS